MRCLCPGSKLRADHCSCGGGQGRRTFGRALGDWLADGSVGKRRRLDAICALLGCPEPPPELRYQLFHRTAAAIIEADRMKADAAAMIVQSFSQEHRWFEDFARFCALLDLHAVRAAPLMRRLAGWPRSDPRLGHRRPASPWGRDAHWKRVRAVVVVQSSR